MDFEYLIIQRIKEIIFLFKFYRHIDLNKVTGTLLTEVINSYIESYYKSFGLIETKKGWVTKEMYEDESKLFG